MSRDLLAKCSLCGYLMPLDPTTDDHCTCGALNKDTGGRFGSTLGDESIEIYRRGG
jgi:hypothetical protein